MTERVPELDQKLYPAVGIAQNCTPNSPVTHIRSEENRPRKRGSLTFIDNDGWQIFPNKNVTEMGGDNSNKRFLSNTVGLNLSRPRNLGHPPEFLGYIPRNF